MEKTVLNYLIIEEKKAFTARIRDGFLWMLRSARIE